MASTVEGPQLQGRISGVVISSLFAEDICLASLTILAYDYILMFRHEIRFIWQSDWRLGKFLYLAIRYLGIINNILATVGNFRHGLSKQACSAIEVASDWTVVVEIGIAQIIIYMRTYIIWGRSRNIKFMLVTLFMIVFIGGCIGYKLTSLTYFTTTSKMVPACAGNGQPTGIAIDYGLVCFSELVVVVLTVWRCIKYEFKDMSALLFVLYRDGILFFVCLFVISTSNIVTVLLWWSDLSMLQCVLHSVLTSRVILHLHIAAAGDEASARTVSLPAFADMPRPANDNMTVLTSSLESMSTPPSANFDIDIESHQQVGTVIGDRLVGVAY
ncbi:hypothetical protein SCHPADRAFT_934861 [Schizopora paradoxa]|uniref:DUF6533 domain-containing protein n=1 Tax=Schizopora paradoxa TaxID=27342 RepID=A0A0H2S8K6_9AGAM|nr:hypothetical protein SCHPADRAFT_934861 [Schizopora paradoxa]